MSGKVTRGGRRLYFGRPCPTTGKRKYRSSLDVMLDHSDNPRLVRAYLCRFCKSWHMTSEPKRSRR